jgi:hypothetical protein
MMPDRSVQGIYTHYKGGRYALLFVAETHDHNGDLDAVYLSLLKGTLVTRPFRRDSRKQDSWTDMVEWPDGLHRQRFTLEATLSPIEMAELARIRARTAKIVTVRLVPVDEMEISVRLHNILIEGGCKTVGDAEEFLGKHVWTRQTKSQRELQAILKEILG